MSVRVEQSGPVTTVILHRPHARNAVDGPTASALADAFRAFEADDAAKVAVLWGDGGTFCAGADLKAMVSGTPNRLAPDGDGPMGPTRMLLSKPVIAAVSGYAVAGGLELALWCDLRVVEEDAIFGVFCRRFGVPLIDGGTVRLGRLIGLSRALDLVLTGRPVAADDVPCPTAEADGACGLLLTLEDRARAEGRDVEAIVRGWSWTPPEPEGGASIARAATRALAGAGAGLDDVAAVEVHATTAEEIVLTTRVLESRTIARRVLGSEAPLGALSPHRVNVRGGSAALGHAPAATGARVILDAARALDGGSRPFALALVSGADGAAGAMLLEAPR